jgi:hypothetical protein
MCIPVYYSVCSACVFDWLRPCASTLLLLLLLLLLLPPADYTLVLRASATTTTKTLAPWPLFHWLPDIVTKLVS